MFSLRQLQQMRLPNHEIQEAIELIKDGDISPPYREQLGHFIVRIDKLVYKPLN